MVTNRGAYHPQAVFAADRVRPAYDAVVILFEAILIGWAFGEPREPASGVRLEVPGGFEGTAPGRACGSLASG